MHIQIDGDTFHLFSENKAQLTFLWKLDNQLTDTGPNSDSIGDLGFIFFF